MATSPKYDPREEIRETLEVLDDRYGLDSKEFVEVMDQVIRERRLGRALYENLTKNKGEHE